METSEIRQQLDELKSEWFWTSVVIRGIEDKLADELARYYDADWKEYLNRKLDENRKCLTDVTKEIARYTDLMKEATPND